MYTLYFDTDCDISPEIAAQYGAKLLFMPYTIDGVDSFPYISWKEYDVKGFYDTLRGGKLPTTSALDPETYKNAFEEDFKEGKDVLYVHFSSAMSATFNALRLAMEELKEVYPERRVVLIDTKMISCGAYALAVQAGELYKQGKSIEEIVEWSKEAVDHQAIYFFADNLKFFAKSGRVSGFSAFMGNIIGIKPIIYIGNDGKMTSIDKAKGRKGAMAKILEYVDKKQENIRDYEVVIAHADSIEIAEELKARLIEKYGKELRVRIHPVNPTIGSHCGPDCVGVTFHAKER